MTLHQQEPIPFLEAVDRLCDAGQLHANFWQSEEEKGRPLLLRLVDGRGDRAPVAHSGPFRISLISIHDHRDLIFEQEARSMFNPKNVVSLPRPPREQFYVRLQVMTEPRMMIRLDQVPRWAEAVDDAGQSLVSNEAGSRRSLNFSPLAPSLISFNVPLRHPDRPGKAIRRLRGVVPVMVSARAPEPLIIPLKDAVGRKVEGRGATLEIREIRDSPGRPWEMKLFIRTEDPREDTGFPSTWLQNSQIELIDAQGQPSRALFSFAYVEKDLKAATLRLVDGERAQTPVEIRYYSLTRSTAEVPFEFTDIEMP